MAMPMRYAALALWLLSWVMPVGTLVDSQRMLGAQVAWQGLVSIVALFPWGLISQPLLVVSLLSNGLFVLEMQRVLTKDRRPFSVWHAWLCVAAAVWNVAIGQAMQPFYPDLYAHAGFYVWAAAFVLLAGSAVVDQRAYFAGLLRRSAALAVVAAVVSVIGVATIVMLG